MNYELVDWICPKCGLPEKTARNAISIKRECRGCRIKRERKYVSERDRKTRANRM